MKRVFCKQSTENILWCTFSLWGENMNIIKYQKWRKEFLKEKSFKEKSFVSWHLQLLFVVDIESTSEQLLFFLLLQSQEKRDWIIIYQTSTWSELLIVFRRWCMKNVILFRSILLMLCMLYFAFHIPYHLSS